MRKIIMFNRVSLDGYFAGPKGETHEWFIGDPKVDKAAHKMMNPDTVLFGRVTYELFEGYWPKVANDKKSPKAMRKVGKELNRMKKLVFSRSLKKVTWKNTQLFNGDLKAEIRKIKKGKGPDIVIFGSGSIVRQLTKEALIDEYLFVVTPVVLGAGKSFFTEVKKLNLKLKESKDFKSGNVMLHYQLPEKEKKEK